MIPRECKRLAEVDFPIAEVGRHAMRENTVRHGHPKALHLWWARRPLAACRAVLLSLLLPDPCDKHCPAEFKSAARGLLARVRGEVRRGDTALRHALLRFIGDVANWELASEAAYLEVARGLVRAASGEEAPLVVDPFSGGGSIPLEALRVGCEAYASDLNPVACLMLKLVLHDLPRAGFDDYVERIESASRAVGLSLGKRCGDLFPGEPNGGRPITFLWARTIKCEATDCGAEIPLIRSFWLSKKEARPRALRPVIHRPKAAPPRVEFELEEPTGGRVHKPTVVNAKATCLACERPVSPKRVQAQLREQQGGARVLFERNRRVGGARLLAVAYLRDGDVGRQYRLATDRDYAPVLSAQERLSRETEAPLLLESINPVRPSPNARGLSAPTRYGMLQFRQLFTARQLLALSAVADEISALPPESGLPLTLALSKLADLSN